MKVMSVLGGNFVRKPYKSKNFLLWPHFKFISTLRGVNSNSLVVNPLNPNIVYKFSSIIIHQNGGR